MFEDREPDVKRLNVAREAVRSFLTKKKRSTTILLCATMAAEAIFLVLLLAFMDFHSRLHWFMFFGFMFIYAPLILISWHNAVKIDHIYYKLIDELKYGDREEP